MIFDFRSRYCRLCLCVLMLGAWAVPSVQAQEAAAERLFREAQRLEDSGDPEAALAELRLLTRQFPNDRLAPKALFQIVQLSHARGDDSGTQSALDQLLQAYPRSEEAAAAFVLQADIRLAAAQSRSDLEEARKTFRRVPLLYGRESHPRLADRSRALIRSGEIGLRLGEYAVAASDFLQVIEDEPPSLWSGRAPLGSGINMAREW